MHLLTRTDFRSHHFFLLVPTHVLCVAYVFRSVIVTPNFYERLYCTIVFGAMHRVVFPWGVIVCEFSTGNEHVYRLLLCTKFIKVTCLPKGRGTTNYP